MLVNAALVIGGLVGLFYGGAWLVRGASNLALSFGVSVLVIALTLVSVGTSMPELLVSLQAALVGKSDLAIGNVIGSNIANIGLILGATGLIAPLSVKAVLLRRGNTDHDLLQCRRLRPHSGMATWIGWMARCCCSVSPALAP